MLLSTDSNRTTWVQCLTIRFWLQTENLTNTWCWKWTQSSSWKFKSKVKRRSLMSFWLFLALSKFFRSCQRAWKTTTLLFKKKKKIEHEVKIGQSCPFTGHYFDSWKGQECVFTSPVKVNKYDWPALTSPSKCCCWSVTSVVPMFQLQRQFSVRCTWEIQIPPCVLED